MSAEDPTAAELLTAINVAILKLVAGSISSYSLGGVTYTYQNLNDLRRLRVVLQGEAAIAAGTRSGGILHADISRRDA